ncbi:unnamed protein product [Schistosoma turkestanicum]|nr:unnamed protein product [Schistosoma turkestanicum]
MCDYQSGLVYQYQNVTNTATQIDIAVILFSFCIILMNYFILYLIFQIFLSSHLISILIMIQITFDTLVCISQIGNKFCPFFLITSEMWINILGCHIWTSEFLNSLFNTFCKQSMLTMLIERCILIYLPNINLLNYPKLLCGLYCFSVAYNIASNLYLILLVKLDQTGQCLVISKMSISSSDRSELIIFNNASLILGDIIPLSMMIIMLILIISHEYKIKFVSTDASQIKPVENHFILLLVLWSIPEILISILDICQHICEDHVEYESICDITHHCLELLRSIIFILHSISLFILLKPMRTEALVILKNVSKFLKKMFQKN